jgi:hypothetical protein
MKTSLEDLKDQKREVSFRMEELRAELRGLEEEKYRLIQEIDKLEENQD